ncbi:MAG: S41 family peptidase [Candidatus Cloacimonetes bacterium]|nr:S41 family peptidase [Candidatus Cloacimonadota bacterium]MBT6993845.1 S41 family peptidase [Candidatus Cloacimonadota bacterium]
MDKISKVILSVSIIGWIIISIVFFNAVNANASNTNIYKKIKLFNDILFKINDHYVEEIDIDQLLDSAIDGMLDETDPHTVYFTRDEFEKFTSDTKGEFGGLGISIDKRGDYITVVSPIEGTPAFRMGIIAGDKIVKVDGESVVGIDTSESIKLMRGQPGTRVVITILRPGVENELEFEIVRDIIKIDSIPYAFKTENGVGYIRVSQFNANTTMEFRENLDKLEGEGIRGLLIDLRSNPGGLLGEAVDMVNEFIGKDKLVVFTKGRDETSSDEYYTRFNRERAGYPVVILVNSGSASASEIFAGSIQDWDRGLVVGDNSFGKGSVQRLFQLPNGNGMKMTIAKYYIKSGRCIHKDLNDKLLKDKRLLNGEMTMEELEKLEDESLEESKQNIFQTIGGRTVYGGGGITPDVKIEQSRLSDFEVEMARKNLFFNYSVDYLLENPDITSDFKISEKMFANYLTYISAHEIEYEQSDVDASEKWMKNRLLANIIGRKFGSKKSYEITAEEDTQLQEALQIFEKCETLKEMFDYAVEETITD